MGFFRFYIKKIAAITFYYLFKTPSDENSVFDVFNMFLLYFSHDGGHV